MIITCKECSTSFNLDASLVKERGSKCRCSVCKHIFTVDPLPVEQAQETETSSDFILEPGVSDFEIEEEDFSIEEDSDFAMDDDTSEAPETSDMVDSDEFSGYDEVLEQETEPEDEASLDEKTIEMDGAEEKNEKMPLEEEKPVLTTTPHPSRRQKKSGIGTPVLLLLLVFLLVAGAYITSVMTEYKIPYISDVQIPFIEQYLKKPSNEILDVKPLPNQESVNGRFVANTTAGTLFVITGRIDNPSDTARRHIQIQGTLITKDMNKTKTKNVYCGNIIPEEMLKTGNIADINKILSVKTGNNHLNSNIEPEANIPFMIVFSDLPDQLQNFTVKVIGFESVDSG